MRKVSRRVTSNWASLQQEILRHRLRKGVFTLSERTRNLKFSLIFAAILCEQDIKFSRNLFGSDFAFAFIFTQCNEP